MNDYSKKIEQYQHWIQQQLEQWIPLSDPWDKTLIQAMRYGVLNGGKRIRPILTLEFCRVSGGDPVMALPIAVAIEMIHCYSLIHDDLPCMDDDDIRRGKPTCHRVFGTATALLAGDALLTKAFEVVSHGEYAKTNPQETLKIIQIISTLAGDKGMVGGQMMDLQSTQQQTLEQLTTMHTKKTGGLIQAACLVGVVCAKGSLSRQQAAQDYGQNIGCAFQLIDDILDVIGDEKKLGKSIGNDMAQGKVTMVDLLGIDEVKRKAMEYSQTAKNALISFEDTVFLSELIERLLTRCC